MKNKGSLLTVFVVVLVDLIGFGIVLPHLAFYASEFHASPFQIGILYTIYSLMQLLFSPVWGGLSDRVGRRPIMILSTLGASFSYVLFAFSHSLFVLFLSRSIAGMMAGNVSAAQAYVADVTTTEDRARGMGLIGAAFGIGFVLGPTIGAGLMTLSPDSAFFRQNHYAILGFFAAALSLTSFLMVLFKLPESLTPSQSGEESRVVKMSVLRPAFWKFLRQSDAASHGHQLFILMASVFLLAFGQSSLYGAFPLFCRTELNLTPGQVALSYAYMGLIAVIVQGGLIHALVKRFTETRLFFVGCLFFVVGLGFISSVTSPVNLFFFLGLMSLGASLSGPTLTSLISQRSDPSKYGTTLGASQGLAALGRAAGPAWGGFLYGISFRLPFAVTALVVSLTFVTGLLPEKS